MTNNNFLGNEILISFLYREKKFKLKYINTIGLYD